MHPRVLHAALKKTPFEPFEMVFPNGEKLPIRHPEAVVFGGNPEEWNPQENDVAILIREPDGFWNLFFPEQLGRLRFPPKRNGNSRPHKPRRNG